MIQETLKQKQLSLDEAHSLLYHIGYSLEEIIDITNEVYNLNQSKEPYNLLCMVIKVLNDGWYPNWEDNTEFKWFNCLFIKGGFSSWEPSSCDTDAFIPSTLCLKSKSLCEVLIENHKELLEKVYK